MPMVKGKEFPYTAKGKAAAAIAAMAPDKGAKSATPKKKAKPSAASPAKKKAPPMAEKAKQYRKKMM